MAGMETVLQKGDGSPGRDGPSERGRFSGRGTVLENVQYVREVIIVQQKLWTYREYDEKEADRLAAGAGISRLLAKVFVSRGVSGAEGIEYVKSFLDMDASRLHDPFLMDGMDKAVERVLRAVGNRERILVYGDYDVDGVTAVSILIDFLASLGADVSYFIPDRMEDGYGITMDSAARVKELEPSVVITVDCGITSVDEVRYLMESGIDVIVTDHHECKQELPQAVAVLNPHKPGCTYPFKDLSGAGVAFKLVQAICISTAGGKVNSGITGGVENHGTAGGTDRYMKYIDLAALSTIADIVPLVGENRILAGLGLKAMTSTGNIGLEALIRASGYGGREISSYAVAFGLAPRVNAAGRLGSADRAVRLFTTDKMVVAEAIARELNEENRLRQETENEILEQAAAYVEEKLDPAKEKVLVICGENWHHGVIGIVASKITERYYRPSIIISIDEDGTGKASARSIRNFDLFGALSACEDLLDRFGGHEMAAGLTIQSSRIEDFRKRINEYADSVLTDEDMIPCLKIDAFVESGDLTLESVSELDKMAPHGESNPKPRFGYMGLRIADIKTVGTGKHLKLRLCDADMSIEAIGFNMGELVQQYRAGDAVDVVFTPDINEWNGSRRLQLIIMDIKPCVFAKLDKNIVFDLSNDYNNVMKLINSLRQQYRLDPAALIPERAELEAVFRYVRARWRAGSTIGSSNGSANGSNSGSTNGSDNGNSAGCSSFTIENLHELSWQMSARLGIRMNYFKLKKALEIFSELGLLKLENAEPGGLVVKQSDGADRVCLETSTLYTRLQAVRRVFNEDAAQNL